MAETRSPISVHDDGPVRTVTVDRPERRNAYDRVTAAALAEAFRAFDADPALSVAVLTGVRRRVLRGRRPQGRWRPGRATGSRRRATGRWA